ncbi:MAG: type I methionyl aminopeptidase [Christensenellales bacterium]|jgi:methionyl aminopeptidase
MITIKNASQIAKMQAAGALLYEVLQALRQEAVAGVTTKELDAMAERMIRNAGAIPSFKGYNGFPASICASLDDVVVHGFPSDAPLEDGHILSIDCGLVLNGWQADSAFTVAIGKVPERIEELIRVTEECFWLGAAQAREGNRLSDISHAVQEHAEKHGFGVVRAYTGHGIGRDMHEDPAVPNYGPAGRGVRLRAGMTLAIEPMITEKKWPVYIADDGWTAITRDHSWCSHYEHTVAVTTGEPVILTLPGAADSEDGK